MSFVRRPHCSARARPGHAAGLMHCSWFVQRWTSPYRYLHTAGGAEAAQMAFVGRWFVPFFFLIVIIIKIKNKERRIMY